jgi:hypothetical protein
MALTAALSRAGTAPRRIHTTAAVTLGKTSEACSVTRIELKTVAEFRAWPRPCS